MKPSSLRVRPQRREPAAASTQRPGILRRTYSRNPEVACTSRNCWEPQRGIACCLSTSTCWKYQPRPTLVSVSASCVVDDAVDQRRVGSRRRGSGAAPYPVLVLGSAPTPDQGIAVHPRQEGVHLVLDVQPDALLRKEFLQDVRGHLEWASQKQVHQPRRALAPRWPPGPFQGLLELVEDRRISPERRRPALRCRRRGRGRCARSVRVGSSGSAERESTEKSLARRRARRPLWKRGRGTPEQLFGSPTVPAMKRPLADAGTPKIRRICSLGAFPDRDGSVLE